MKELPSPSSRRRFPVLAACLAAGGLSALPLSVHAADATWNLNNPGSWSSAANWTPANAPGSTSTTNNTDTATFGNVITAARTITIDANRNISGINFAGNSFAYTLGGGSLLLSAGGTLQTSGGGTAHTDLIISPITLQGNYTFSANSTTSGRILAVGNSSTTNMVTSAATSGVTTLTLNGSNTSYNEIKGIISNGGGTNTLEVVKSGTGTWRLSGANTFTGGIRIQDGTLDLTSVAAAGGGSTNPVTLGDSSVNGNATLSFSSFNTSLLATQSLTVAANTAGGTRTVVSNVTSNTSGAIINAPTVLNGDVTLRTTSTGFLRMTGGISGTGKVTINNTGTGQVVYFGTNSYTGATDVTAGTLFVSSTGTIGAASTVNVYAGGVLAGTGTVNGATTVQSGGILHGGNTSVASGTLTITNDLTMTDGSIIELSLGGLVSGNLAHSTIARAGGTWVFDSNQAFTFLNIGDAATTGVYENIITGIAAGTAGLSTINTWTITNAGWSGTFSYDGANIDLTLTAVPEPGSVGLLLGTLAVASVYCVRRRLRAA